jgi:ABC-type glycerol-3-phosphate transport system substrate-binding protein
MRERLFSFAIAAALAGVSGSACAMSSGEVRAGSCQVVGGEKLPVESGGSDALCKAIVDAVEEQAPGMRYQVEVTVFPRSRLTASIMTGDGRKLPDQSFVRIDKPLSSGAFKRFATAIAGELAKAGVKKS